MTHINFLRYWQPDRNEIFIQQPGELFGNDIVCKPYNDCGLAIEAKGTWFSTSMYEIPILAIVNEVYFSFKYNMEEKETNFMRDSIIKFSDLVNGKYEIGIFSEFGMRRRLSAHTQNWLVKFLVEREVPGFIGTSNVYLAMKYNVTPIGTYAHEFVQMYQGIDSIPLAYTNHYAMKDWYAEYDGDNGTALTDTVTTDLFLLDFNRSMVNNYTGVRHDSGDPYAWGEKIISHYKKYGVDPKTKLLLFSDSLDFDRAQKLYDYFCDKAKVSFGIGTFVSNDTCEAALNIVIKLQYVNGRPVAKLSDTPGKSMCRDTDYLEYLKRSVNFRIEREK